MSAGASPATGDAMECADPPSPDRRRLARRRRLGRPAVVPAGAGDHPAIFHFLSAVFQAPSRGEFRASLDDPFYEPHHRLVVRHDGRIVGHVLFKPRTMRFGSVEVPMAGLDWLGVAPDLCGLGLGQALLEAAQRHAASDGALVGLLWTRMPHYFRPHGWALCGWQSASRASPRNVLAGLCAQGLHPRKRARLSIRPCRRMEIAALRRIYQENLPGSFGPLERTEAYWEWLVARRAFDRILVALDGPDLLELEENRAPIVGYAVTRRERIVELHHAPKCRRAAVELLARVCHDAIEHDLHRVVLEARPDSPLHELLTGAGPGPAGHPRPGQRVLMAKLLEPVKLLRRLGPEILDRARAAPLPRPLELGFLVDGRKFRLKLLEKGVRAAAHHLGRSYLRMNVADFTRLVLGRLDWDQALAAGRVAASTQLALAAGRSLFPWLPFCRPTWDDLPSQRTDGAV